LLAAEDVRCEVPFCYRDETPEGTVIWNGIIDVMYCEGGKWHIVDYKTNADGEDLDTKYQNQLAAYVKAFKQTKGIEADAKIYHIDL
jgi:ATP-dependent exoDNAse (exonuclease V) beta subunit